jgi:hypothetical protein
LAQAVADRRDWRISEVLVRSLAAKELHVLRATASSFYGAYNFDAVTGDLVFFRLKEQNDNAIQATTQSRNSGGPELDPFSGDRVVED